ncbi:Fur family transcriptional regulator [Butyrivibrio sp. FCS014]|uniref:Fur family transcriptional regulator n=1 Tax=Butyrivibrio sp. FCS014 TaxID=1408304 RepID=UPI000464D76E|nr:transcriptional repressor [Butyrivibrio sp. FCS014]
MMNNEQIVEALKESGMRITRQRMIVADVIADNDGASCKDICCIVRSKDSSVGVATVYRMINVLEDIGVIERIDMIKHRRNGDEG